MTIAKYLNRYAAAEADLNATATQAALQSTLPESLPELIAQKYYDHVLVVPLFDEWHNQQRTCVQELLQHVSQRVLTIAVVNTPEHCEAGAYSRTQSLLRALLQHRDTLVIDRASHGRQIAASKGVGLARKIGSDLALALIARGVIRQPWIYQTDADAILPANYFMQSMPDQGAVVFSHHHVSADATLQQAADLYDLHMRYYIAGLADAGSSYAHPSLGSTIAIHAQTYADVRGYPQRNAGEDFYLLNKARKVAGIHQRNQVNIRLTARLSQRVPFGTGPALRKITRLLAAQPDGCNYLSYHPQSFTLLKDALLYLRDAAAAPTRQHHPASGILMQLGFGTIAAKLYQQYPGQLQRQRILTEWFDGFRQLRFIHEARLHFPDQPLLHSVQQAAFIRT